MALSLDPTPTLPIRADGRRLAPSLTTPSIPKFANAGSRTNDANFEIETLGAARLQTRSEGMHGFTARRVKSAMGCKSIGTCRSPWMTGLVLRCDVYRPIGDGKHPVLMTYGPYGKWLHFEDLYNPISGGGMCADHPDVPTGSTNKSQCWEVVDPEKWGALTVTSAFASTAAAPAARPASSTSGRCARRRTSRSASTGPALQPWSNGKVGLNGISSYYAENQWQTAALQPKHLAAICTLGRRS